MTKEDGIDETIWWIGVLGQHTLRLSVADYAPRIAGIYE